VAAIVHLASADRAIEALTAETAVDNIASQRVLEKNDFVRTGHRIDEEDGEVIGWIKTLR
jgi:RimJ/RimL family protein N-acetyltransferase